MQDIKFPALARFAIAACVCFGALGVQAQTVDVDAAKKLAKKSDCTKCHSDKREKEGPAYQETAAKYKGKADAEATLFKHLTTGPKVKVDGVEEEHKMVKSTDEADIMNLVRYILSR